MQDMRLVRKHRAPNGALRQLIEEHDDTLAFHQKAPSAQRCIKTLLCGGLTICQRVRKHQAPKGASRQLGYRFVRHPGERQKAPSTKRCIKTR